MSRSLLTINLGALKNNWRALNAMSATETAAVVKADGYGLNAEISAPALADAGAKTFFVALAEEGAAVRRALGPGPRIFNFSGLMPGDTEIITGADLIPLLNSAEQVRAARAAGINTVGLQLDTGMNRLGMEQDELTAILNETDGLSGQTIALVMSHLACADEPDHPQNAAQHAAFIAMTSDPRIANAPRSLAATGGVLMGADYHFDLTRPGIGLYGGAPYNDAQPVIQLQAPIIQIRDVAVEEAVGYGGAWVAKRPSKIATISGGYADGLIRAMSGGLKARYNDQNLPFVGRVSMDLITLDVTDCPDAAEGALVSLIDDHNTVDILADAAGTIGYEILTSLGARYQRRYIGA
ncbi:MAG: alanine racemase [Pikeienuella sp.]